MTILLEQQALPEQGIFELNIQRSIEIKVTAEQARRKVNLWLLNEVSNMMGAREPILAIGERITWRVPVVLTAPHVGMVGIIGEIDIDVQTGEMNVTPEHVTKLQVAGVEMGNKMLPYTPRKDMPGVYWAKTSRPTHAAPTPNQDLIQKLTTLSIHE